MDFAVLYFHLLFACIWIGGMVTLVGYIIYTKGKKDKFFYRFALYYGWLNIAVLCFLVASGIYLAYLKNLHFILFDTEELSRLLQIKIALVFLMLIAAFYRSFVVLKAEKRTKIQNIFSKISSFYLLFGTFLTLYIAVCIRELL